MVEISKQRMARFINQFPNWKEEDIEKHVKEFELVFVDGGIIKSDCATYTRYLKGWLVCAYFNEF